MGWGGKGKGWAHHHHHHHGLGWAHHHHHHHGLGPLGVAAEALAVGAAAGVVAATVARPVPPRRPPQTAPVVFVEPAMAQPFSSAVVAQPATAVAVAQPACVIAQPATAIATTQSPVPVAIYPSQLPPLQIAQVRLPAERIEKQASVTFYCVQVIPNDGSATWHVARRYNDFKELSQKLGRAAVHVPFPPKQFCCCGGQSLEQRRSGLEVWLSHVIQHPLSMSLWLKFLHDFLEAGRTFTAVAPLAPAAAQALAPVPQSPEATLQTLVNIGDVVIARNKDPRFQSVRIWKGGPAMEPVTYIDNGTKMRVAELLPVAGHSWLKVDYEGELFYIKEANTAPHTQIVKGSRVRVIENFESDSLPRTSLAAGWEGIVVEMQTGSAAICFDQLQSNTMWVRELDFGKLEVIRNDGDDENTGKDSGTLEVEIPGGIGAGQLLGVAVPDGRQLVVSVPEGYGSGSKLQLWFDPMGEGSLTPLL